jgi:hypothetical protein
MPLLGLLFSNTVNSFQFVGINFRGSKKIAYSRIYSFSQYIYLW